MFNETKYVSKVISIDMEMRLNPRLKSDMYRRHGGPKGKDAKQERQSVRTTTTHQQRIQHVKLTKQSDSKHFFPDWIGQCEKKSWNHILGVCNMTQNIHNLVYGNHCENISTHKLVYDTTHTHTKFAKCLGALLMRTSDEEKKCIYIYIYIYIWSDFEYQLDYNAVLQSLACSVEPPERLVKRLNPYPTFNLIL